MNLLKFFKVIDNYGSYTYKRATTQPSLIYGTRLAWFKSDGSIEIVSIGMGLQEFKIPFYKKFDTHTEEDAERLLYTIGRLNTHLKVDKQHSLRLKCKNGYLYINTEGWFDRPFDNGKGNLIVVRDYDIIWK